MNTMLVLKLFLLFTVCYCKSIQIQNTTLNESQDDRIERLENKIRNLENRIHMLNETEQKRLMIVQPAMFYAIIGGRSFTLNMDSTVVFEKIIINIGDHYNKYDGVFVAPRKGVYMFSWTIAIYSSNYAVTELVVENDVISSTGDTATSGGYHSTSMTALCMMEKGYHAFIRTTGFGGTNYIYSSSDNYPRSSFMGMSILY